MKDVKPGQEWIVDSKVYTTVNGMRLTVRCVSNGCVTFEGGHMAGLVGFHDHFSLDDDNQSDDAVNMDPKPREPDRRPMRSECRYCTLSPHNSPGMIHMLVGPPVECHECQPDD